MIPARAGSKGLPGKNLAPFAGLPLIAHSILLARSCPEIERTIVSTDSEEIADAARGFGAEVPFLRPAELAADEAPMWPVLQHALERLDSDGTAYASLLLLQPTSPARLAEDVGGAVALLSGDAEADGVVGVSEPVFNPLWSAVVERGGYLEPLVPQGVGFARRQDVPRVLRVNGSLYLWRTGLVREHAAEPPTARLLPWEIPERRAIDIDTADDLELAELFVREGLVALPWLA